MFGPEYPKVNTLFKRDERNVVVPGDWSLPEFAYLADCPWDWTEKVDGTNIRLHWNGSNPAVGGRSDGAQVPARLTAALNLTPVMDLGRWRSVFPDAGDVTVYGEGYGAGIQKGGVYRPDQTVVVFDVLVGPWWLSRDDVADVAVKLGLETVPSFGQFSVSAAWADLTAGKLASRWDGAPIEGLVGRPAVDLFNRKGERVIAKMKVRDWNDYQRRKVA